MIEAKIMLAMIIHRFHFEVAPGQKDAADIAITLRSDSSLFDFPNKIHPPSFRPKYGMWMKVTPR